MFEERTKKELLHLFKNLNILIANVNNFLLVLAEQLENAIEDEDE